MMGTESSESKSGSGADSYIGSLISLTSKSEIRYEGVLYNINTEESSIGLRNVRSFGTEGRKKDGPQVPPSEKVYEYILFRGSDIKDLQVKSSPPVQHAAPINDDPAIIQPQYIRPVSSSTGFPSAAIGPLTDIGSQSSQMGLSGSNFQGGLPLYQPGGNLGPWGASAPPSSANGSGLAMPMYWQGYYGPPNGLTQLHQQSLLQPPPGLQMPLQPMQYPNFNTSFPTGPSNLHSSSLPEVPSSLLPASMNSANLTSASLPSSTLPPVPSNSPASETLPSLLPTKAPSSVLPTATPGASMQSLSPLTASTPDLISAVPTSDLKYGISGSTLPIQSTSQSVASILETSSSVRTETPTPSLVTPGQLLQHGPAVALSSQSSITGPTVAQSSQSSITVQKDVEAVEASASPSAPVAKETQPPILPLPVPSQAAHKPNGAPFHARGGYRGRGRGWGNWGSRPMEKFTEDFDFMAMNEKFNKDEVWGDLGKSEHSKDKEVDASEEDSFPEEHDVELPQIDAKPVYNKDDFFDSLSCNSIGHDSQNRRPRFSEQRKIDTETFGEFPRNHGGRGGRGRGGRHHGYYGRGYGGYNGYNNRGRGRDMPNRAS